MFGQGTHLRTFQFSSTCRADIRSTVAFSMGSARLNFTSTTQRGGRCPISSPVMPAPIAMPPFTSSAFWKARAFKKGEAQPTLEMIRKLSKALIVSADGLLFDEEERGPDDALRLQFEALKQFDQDERQTAKDVLEGLILKHQARQHQMRNSR